MESFEVDEADSTACFSNFFDDEEFTLTFLAVTSDICNHFRSTMSLQSIRNRSGKIRRRSLLSPRSSAFMQLYNGGQDDALITMTGLNYSTFHELLAIFSPIFHEYTPHVNSGCNISHLPYRRFRRGRRRTIDAIIALSLVLVWTRTRGTYASLQVIFGMTASNISKWLRFSKHILLLALMGVEEAKIQMPSLQQVRLFQEVIRARYPTLTHVWGAMDGLKVTIHKPTDDIMQSHFYNGWTHGHYIANLFLFTPDGHIRAAYLNSPGTTHDSTMATMSRIYNQIDDVFYSMEGTAKVVVDSAFAAEDRPSLVKSFSNNVRRDGQPRQPHRLNNDATSVRQMAEWGMQGFQSSFPRLKEKLLYEE